MARRVGLEYQESISADDVEYLSDESAMAQPKEKKEENISHLIRA